MADILHDLPVQAPLSQVFQAISTPEGLDLWWTKASTGTARENSVYELDFGPGHLWTAKVTRSVPDSEFEFEMVRADDDWTGTRIGFRLENRDGKTWLRFHHTGWPEVNEHYRISCNCWAMYLRILRRNLECGEFVPYEHRLDA